MNYKQLYFHTIKKFNSSNINDLLENYKNDLIYTSFYSEYKNNMLDKDEIENNNNNDNVERTVFDFLMSILIESKDYFAFKLFNYIMYITRMIVYNSDYYLKHILNSINYDNAGVFIQLYKKWVSKSTPTIFQYNYYQILNNNENVISYCRNYKILNYMINNRFEIQKCDGNKNNLLHYAATFSKNFNDLNIVKTLLTKIDKTTKNKNGFTPLMLAIYYFNTSSCIETIKLLIDEKTVNMQNDNLENALLISIKRNNPIEINNLLIEYGADENMEDKFGNTYYKIFNNKNVYISKQCLVCYENNGMCMYFPCMHCVICISCFNNVNNNSSTCIYCRSNYTTYYKLKHIE